MKDTRNFASDNNATVHPEVMKALADANIGHVISYGDDEVTEAATAKLKEIFGKQTGIYFVYNGTGANVLGLSSLLAPYNAVICPESAHINVDECGAPEKLTGCKLLTVPTADGKLSIKDIKTHLHGIGDEHHSQPRAVSITQSTELGTVYRPSEVREIADFVHENGMLLHMDGARIANAAAALGLGLREVSIGCGVDVLSFGGTKNGLMFGEAVVFASSDMASRFKFIRKQGMQLASKMRFIAAQFLALTTNDLWLGNASHANRMAKLLEEKVRNIPGIQISQKVEANAIFARIPHSALDKIRENYFFYVTDEEACEVRWMTAFDTTEEDVAGFADAVSKAVR